MSQVTVVNDQAAGRYQASIDDRPAGFIDYEVNRGVVVLTHTEVGDGFEGKGVGSALARFALDDIRAAGTHTVLPFCPFIKAWITRHPEYSSLLDPAH